MAGAPITRTALDSAGILVGDSYPEEVDQVITFGSATTYSAGTLLALDTSTKKYVAYVKGGVTNGNGVVSAVLRYDVTSTGAGDFSCRALIRGDVNLNRLIILADGNATNIDATVQLQMRNAGITPINVKQIAGVDN